MPDTSNCDWNDPQLGRFLPETPLPTLRQVRDLWDRHCMMEHIRDHSRMVCLVALAITDWLAAGGLTLNRSAVETGSLLHDIAKTPCFESKKRHDFEGCRIMVEEGFPQLAYLVRWHVSVEPTHPLDETMVVNYADKRVTHDQLVTLDQRYDYIEERYGRGDPANIERLRIGRSNAHAVETLIFQHIPGNHHPQDIMTLAKENA